MYPPPSLCQNPVVTDWLFTDWRTNWQTGLLLLKYWSENSYLIPSYKDGYRGISKLPLDRLFYVGLVSIISKPRLDTNPSFSLYILLTSYFFNSHILPFPGIFVPLPYFQNNDQRKQMKTWRHFQWLMKKIVLHMHEIKDYMKRKYLTKKSSN